MGLSKILRHKSVDHIAEGGTAGLTQWVRPQFKIYQEISLATNFPRFLQVLESQKGIQLAVEPTAQVDRAPTLAQPQQQQDVTSKPSKHKRHKIYPVVRISLLHVVEVST
jgi:hypothetical protein